MKTEPLPSDREVLAGLVERAEGRKYGYLVVPKKLPRDEWVKVAARALKHNLEPDPRFKRPEEVIKITRRANRGDT
jgi:hypothetical protein